MLDGSADVVLPQVDGVPGGATAVRVSAFEVPGFSAGNFSLLDADATVSRASEDQAPIR